MAMIELQFYTYVCMYNLGYTHTHTEMLLHYTITRDYVCTLLLLLNAYGSLTYLKLKNVYANVWYELYFFYFAPVCCVYIFLWLCSLSMSLDKRSNTWRFFYFRAARLRDQREKARRFHKQTLKIRSVL